MSTLSLGATLLVGVGGAAGALARAGVGTRLPGARATFVVNVLGSLGLGALVASGVAGDAALLAGAGFCGAFTTFSSFAVEVVNRYEAGDIVGAASYATLTLLSALVGVGVGTLLGSAL